MAKSAKVAKVAYKKADVKKQPTARVSTSQIQVQLSEYKGREFCDIRTWYLDKEDEWRPTQKGVCVDLDQLGEIIEALQQVQADMA